jgi:hypothetical protein
LIKSIGHFAEPEGDRRFLLRDLSIKGFRAYFEEDPGLVVHRASRFYLPDINIQGIAVVKWVAPTTREGARLGCEFSRILANPLATPTADPHEQPVIVDIAAAKVISAQDQIDVRQLGNILVELSNSILSLIIGGYRDEIDATQRQREAVIEMLNHIGPLSEEDQLHLAGVWEHVRVIDGLIREALERLDGEGED